MSPAVWASFVGGYQHGSKILDPHLTGGSFLIESLFGNQEKAAKVQTGHVLYNSLSGVCITRSSCSRIPELAGLLGSLGGSRAGRLSLSRSPCGAPLGT